LHAPTGLVSAQTSLSRGGRRPLFPETDCAHITLATIVAAYENVLDRQAWRNGNGRPENQYLLYLDELGYQLSTVEQLAAGIEAIGEPTGSDD
jgi:hypothetical protein